MSSSVATTWSSGTCPDERFPAHLWTCRLVGVTRMRVRTVRLTCWAPIIDWLYIGITTLSTDAGVIDMVTGTYMLAGTAYLVRGRGCMGMHDVGQPLGPAEHHPASASFASIFSSKGGLCPMPAFVQSPMAKHVLRELLYPSAARACHRTCPETYHISTPGSSTIDRRRWPPEKLASSLVVSSWSSGQADTDQKSLTVSVGEPKHFATVVLGTVNFQRVAR